MNGAENANGVHVDEEGGEIHINENGIDQQHDQDVEDINARLDTLMDRINVVKNDVSNVQESVQSINNKVEIITKDVNDLDTSVKDIKSIAQNSHDGWIDSLATTTDIINSCNILQSSFHNLRRDFKRMEKEMKLSIDNIRLDLQATEKNVQSSIQKMNSSMDEKLSKILATLNEQLE